MRNPLVVAEATTRGLILHRKPGDSWRDCVLGNDDSAVLADGVRDLDHALLLPLHFIECERRIEQFVQHDAGVLLQPRDLSRFEVTEAEEYRIAVLIRRRTGVGEVEDVRRLFLDQLDEFGVLVILLIGVEDVEHRAACAVSLLADMPANHWRQLVVTSAVSQLGRRQLGAPRRRADRLDAVDLEDHEVSARLDHLVAAATKRPLVVRALLALGVEHDRLPPAGASTHFPFFNRADAPQKRGDRKERDKQGDFPPVR